MSEDAVQLIGHLPSLRTPNLFELGISAFRYDHPSPSHFLVLFLFSAFPEGVQSSLYTIRLSGNYFSLDPSIVPALILTCATYPTSMFRLGLKYPMSSGSPCLLAWYTSRARVHKLVTACRYKDPSAQMPDLRIYTDLAYSLQLRHYSLPSEGYSFFSDHLSYSGERVLKAKATKARREPWVLSEEYDLWRTSSVFIYVDIFARQFVHHNVLDFSWATKSIAEGNSCPP